MELLGDNFFVRLFASICTFSFIYVWHGTQKSVLIWSILNFLGITLEATAKGVGKSTTYQRIEVRAPFPDLFGSFIKLILSAFVPLA